MYSFHKETNQNNFFELLPDDWKNEIKPIWDSYKQSSAIYILKKDNQLAAGGIVFSTCPPDMVYNKPEAEKMLNKGYLYIGFVWVIEELRNQNLGSKWLEMLKAENPIQKYWLTIEEENLKFFYMKNGFQITKELLNGPNKEWVLVYEPSSRFSHHS